MLRLYCRDDLSRHIHIYPIDRHYSYKIIYPNPISYPHPHPSSPSTSPIHPPSIPTPQKYPTSHPLSWPVYPHPSLLTNKSHSQPGSQSAFTAIGGYSTPSFSTFGSHVHQFSRGNLSITMGMCWPQPHQEVFSVSEGGRLVIARERERGGEEGRTAGGAGSGFTHCGCRWVGRCRWSGRCEGWSGRRRGWGLRLYIHGLSMTSGRCFGFGGVLGARGPAIYPPNV